MTYNDTQRQAIEHIDGPMLTLAGPGSGKTTVITRRVQYLIANAKIAPYHILVITFTRAAAREMQNRFYDMMQGERPACTFGTFHSVFFMILKAAYHYTGENVLTEDVKYQLLREIISGMDIEFEDREEFLQGIAAEISEVKSELIALENYYSKNCGEEEFRTIFRVYRARLAALQKIDFDDMLVYCYELLRERPDILAGWQNRFQYILIDEFQDINPIQYEIIKMLAAPGRHLFIVGDDDQSIYRFRGARPELMRQFLEDYHEAKQVLLNINYRCSRDICESALRVISSNQNRFPKEILADRDYSQPVMVHRVQTRKDENLHILKKMQEYKKQGIPYEQMAVLYRTNIQPGALVRQLIGCNIPFQMRDMLPGLYRHFAVQDILAYIRLAMGEKKRESFLRVINKPKRYISREAFSEETVELDSLMAYYKDKKWAVDNLIQFSNDLHVLRKMTPFAAVAFIRKAVGYDDYLKEYADYRRINVEELYQVLDELSEQIRDYRTFEAMFEGIAAYEDALKKRQEKEPRSREGVTLATMHSAKGLEYDVVFILEANEGVTPHKKSSQPEEIEEERRMFYVAMTRARSYLHIYSLSELFGKPIEASRFLGELLLNPNKLTVGSRVIHKQFGEGELTFINADKISIYFSASGETKTFLKKYLLEKQLIRTEGISE